MTMDEPLPFKKPWLRCVGSERVGTMLRKDYWERFDQIRRFLPFERIRCHGLLCDDVGLLRVDEHCGERRAFFNFTYLDEVFDAMLERGVRPFVEIGFMPQALASGTQTVFWWKGNVTPPADGELWTRTLQALVSHWIERYGRAEALSWPIEIWNEPNLDGFWEKADMEAYFRLYKESVLAIKAIDPGYKVGGPAICGIEGADLWLEAFLDFARYEGLPLDFVTRHLYTVKGPVSRSPELLYQYLNPVSVPLEELKSVRERIDRAGYPDLALHITEFNTSYHPQCPLHDTALNAAYLARLLSESGDWAETMSYWTFSDLFEEADIPRSLFHGGFGLLARHGIPKPTFHLFHFFSRLGDTRLMRDESFLLTRREDGSLALAAWNPVLDKAEHEPKVIELSLPWTGGRALIRRRRVHEGQGNPRAHWAAMGRPRFPRGDEIEYLRLCASPAAETGVLDPAGGRLGLRVELLQNEVTLLEIRPLRDESPTYLGLNDDLIVEG